MSVYMEIEGIKGNVTADGHKEWIGLSSFSYGISRPVSTPAGSTKNREVGAPNISEIQVTKEMDQASPYLFTESCIGKGKKVKVHFCRTSQDKLETYLEYELENAVVSSYSVSSGGERPTESFALNFTKIVTKYIPWKEDHAKDSPHPAGYDLTLAKKV